MNIDRYPWLSDLSSTKAKEAIETARKQYVESGAVTFPEFISPETLATVADEARSLEGKAFVTEDQHNVFFKPSDPALPGDSVRNFEMHAKASTIASDELSPNSDLTALYEHPTLRELVAKVVHGNGKGSAPLYLSEDPVGSCYLNAFPPGYYTSFHFDQAPFTSTIMLQEASERNSGLFQYTFPIRDSGEDLALEAVSSALNEHEETAKNKSFVEGGKAPVPKLHSLEFKPGTLSIFAGNKSLHRVSKVEGNRTRLVAVLTFATKPGFHNSARVQELFWGRSVPPPTQ